GISALQATLGFKDRDFLRQTQVHLIKIGFADEGILLRHFLPIDLEPLFGRELGCHWSSADLSLLYRRALVGRRSTSARPGTLSIASQTEGLRHTRLKSALRAIIIRSWVSLNRFYSFPPRRRPEPVFRTRDTWLTGPSINQNPPNGRRIQGHPHMRRAFGHPQRRGNRRTCRYRRPLPG